MTSGIFFELSVILLITFIISFIIRLLKQPLIISYIISGIIVGPYILNFLETSSTFEAFSQIGVSILLFMVGLSLNPKVIKDVGIVAVITGIGQIIFTVIIGFFLSKILGFSTIASIYIAIALSFSSTIIIMKILSDIEDLDSLYGKISIGFLLVQDLVAIIILMMISSTAGGVNLTSLAVQKIGTGAALILLIFGISFFILPLLTKKIAKSQELLLLFSIVWALALSSLFSYTGFSIEIGALIAGVSLSISPYRFEISSKMKPLRDFFLLLFFIFLGSQMIISDITSYIPHILAFSALVMIGNPIIIMSLMGVLGYTKRNGFLAALTTSQISEFSFILVALGIKVGHLSNEILSIITLVGLITMASSTYAILYGKSLYQYFSPYISIFERKGNKIDEGKYHLDKDYDIILFGYNRIGYNLVASFKKIKKKFLIVDYNPEIIKSLIKRGIDCRYGDASDIELLNDIPLKSAKMIISTIPEFDTNELLIRKIKKVNKDAIIITISHQIDEALSLYDSGATYVITPHFLGGSHTASLIEKYLFNREKFDMEGMNSMKELTDRKKAGHEHPFHERG